MSFKYNTSIKNRSCVQQVIGIICLLSITLPSKIDHDKYHEWHRQNELEEKEESEEKDKQAKLRVIQKESFHNIDNRSVQSVERAKKQNQKSDKQRRKLKKQQHAQRAQQQIQNKQIQSYHGGSGGGERGDTRGRRRLLPSVGDGRDYLSRNDDDYNGNEIKLINPDEQHQNSWYAYSSVIGGILAQIVLGALFSFGNLVPYFAAYLTYWKHYSEGSNRDALAKVR